MKTRKQIAMAFSIGLPRFERLIDGIINYARTNELEWSFISIPEHPFCTINDLPEWPGDGVIAHLDTQVEGMLASTFHIPIINVSGSLEQSPVPRVLVDNYAVGRMAAEHLIKCGFKRFGFYGLENLLYSDQRLQGFRDTLAEGNYDCEVLLVPPTYRLNNLDWKALYENLESWLRGIPLPMGLFCVSDARARIVLDICNEIHIPVPAKLAIISVDNEQTICEHNNPTLSSIDKNDCMIGWQAAKILDDVMNGREIEEKEQIVQPKGIVQRHTTDVLSVEDDKLAQAIEFIRTHYQKPITVEWVAQHIDASRRWLEYSFRENTKVSPYQYLCDYRINKSKHLLEIDDKLSIAEIAQRTGFDNPKHFNGVFKRIIGESPTQYRRKYLRTTSTD